MTNVDHLSCVARLLFHKALVCHVAFREVSEIAQLIVTSNIKINLNDNRADMKEQNIDNAVQFAALKCLASKNYLATTIVCVLTAKNALKRT
jgi:hypothetical protein